jgi:hypothetical protein
MNDTKSFCRHCKKAVEFVPLENAVVCPDCGQRYELSEITQATDSEGSGCLRSFVILLLILLAIGLVGLAFIYAACSGMGNI